MRIIGLSGTAESGKSTLSNFLVGEIMIERGMIDEYSLDEKGELWCLSDILEDKKLKKQKVKFDHRNIYRDPNFECWAQQELYPHIKVFSLARPLKDCACDLFGLTTEQVYFNKTDITDITYEKMMSVVPVNNRPAWDKQPNELLTVREVLEALGSGVFRSMKLTCFVEACLSNISRYNSAVSVIDDVRTPFEIESIQKAGGKVIRLNRGKAPNYSEQGIYEAKVDYELNNKYMNIPQMLDAATKIIKEINES